RNELDGRRTCAYNRNPLSAEVVIVPPLSRVKRGAGEAFESRNGREFRVAQRADAKDQEPRDEVATLGAHAPRARGLVPGGVFEAAVEVDVRHDTEGFRALAQVRPDLRLRRIRACPVGLWRERERVQARRNVARAPWIGVVPPRTTDIASSLEHHEIVDAG